MEKNKCYEIEIIYHCPKCDDKQATFLVRGITDVLWTEKIKDVINYIKEELEEVVKLQGGNK